MVYIVMNNGVYGLDQGTVLGHRDKGSQSKRGVPNNDEPIDLASLALQLGATFVARSFSGDKAQLVPLIEAAIAHRGAAFIDVISPCVAFNNHPGSTKSYDYVREHNEAVNRIDFITSARSDHHGYAPGTVQEIVQHDGTVIRLRKVDRTTTRTTGSRR
jgi:2-oxoglutarate ferredoxin oxidoreductase subunit beta